MAKQNPPPRAGKPGARPGLDENTLEIERADLPVDDISIADGGEGEFDDPTILADEGQLHAQILASRRDSGEDITSEAPVEHELAVAEGTVRPKGGSVIEMPTTGSESGELPAHVRLPERMGEYTLIELLGLGGMAEVFVARQEGVSGFSRKLVIKRIHPHLSQDERFVQMFLREAGVAAGLQHPNIVRIDELSQHNGIYFIAMEYVDGLTLLRLARRAWRNGKSLPMELAVAAAADAASALHYAHTYVDPEGQERRIVHRDVSPDNLIIDRAGVTKLLDFGVAKAAGSISVTRAGEVKGKVPYMAPEQLHGKPLDGRADLYSLGATLYWLLTGRRPFDGETDLEVMHAIAFQQPQPPRELNPEIPERLEELILRLLSKKPDERYENGQLVADELLDMMPPSRREVAAFVAEAFELGAVDDAAPISTSSFVAATPRTAHLITTGRRMVLEGALKPPEQAAEAPSISSELKLASAAGDGPERGSVPLLDLAKPAAREDILAVDVPGPVGPVGSSAVAPSSRKWAIAALGGAALAVAIGVAALSLVGGDEEVTAAAALPPVPDEAAQAEPAEGAWEIEDSANDEVKPADKKATDKKATEKKPTQAPEKKPPAASEQAAATPPGKSAPPAKRPEEKPRAPEPPSHDEGDGVKRSASKAAAVETRTVSARGPGAVRWLLGKKTLGSGNATLEVPAGTTSIVAFHTKRKVRTTIALSGNSVSYDDAPTGTLDMRVFPFATLFIGDENLGQVPPPKRTLPVGTYQLRFEHEGKSKTETVTVEQGMTTKVKVNMQE